MSEAVRDEIELPTLAELAAWERPTVRTPEDILIERQDAELLYRAMEALPARYERVLRLHNGINCPPMTFGEIAEQYGGLGRGRMQQIEQTSCRRMAVPLMPKFRERLGAQRLRRELDAETKEAARVAAFWAERQAEDDMRAEAERHNAIIDEAVRREADRQAQEVDKQIRRRWKEDRDRAERTDQIRREILRRAEMIELELDQIPRQRKQRAVNPFGFSAKTAAEYAEVLRALALPHYRMRT
jgi:hypothetical protein